MTEPELSTLLTDKPGQTLSFLKQTPQNGCNEQRNRQKLPLNEIKASADQSTARKYQVQATIPSS